MRSLYISQQGCSVSLQKEFILIKQQQTLLQQVQLPFIEQILLFGQSQITTQAVRACLWRNIPILYLSQMGQCYGRLLPLAHSYRALARRQHNLTATARLTTAQAIVQAKLHNSRVLLLRQQRRPTVPPLTSAIQGLDYLHHRAAQATTIEQLLGFEGAGAACYFAAFGQCLTHPELQFTERTRRPPQDPVNAMLSFGYQLLWNHLFSLIELRGLDPYDACLHQGSDRHAALVSDLIEAFRAPLIDSLVLYLVNRASIKTTDFDYPATGGCYLNATGRKRFLHAFLQRMETPIQTPDGEQPRWALLNQQVKAYKHWVNDPTQPYIPYTIR